MERAKKILAKLRDDGCEALDEMLDKWEAATEIRRWLKEKQSNLMQKFLEQAKKSVLKMIKDGVALEMDKVIEVAEDERIEDTDDSQLTEE